MAESNVIRFEDRLLNSIQTFKNEEAKSLLNKNLVKAKTHYGSLLHYAAKYDNDDVARHLIGMGSEVDCLGRGNQTPLMVAVLHTNKKCVKVLLEAGANVDFPNEKGQTALNLVFDCGYVAMKDIFRLFLDKLKTQITSMKNLAIKLMDAGCTFHYVAREDDYNLMASMLKCGAEVSSKSFVNKTALHAAIEIKSLRWVKWLLENGTNLNVLDEYEKNNLLLLACYEADIVILQLLLEEGVNPNGLISGNAIKWMEGRPLCELLSKTDLDKSIVTACIELLFQYGAIPRNPSDCWSIFDYAFLSGDSVWAKYLIARLAMLEKTGTSIDLSNLLRCHFPDYQAKLASLSEYYNKCKNVLEIILFRKLSLFDLLTDKESNIRSYVRNDAFISEVKKVCLQQEIDKLYPYYYNTLIRRINEAIDGVKLEDVAIPILYDLFGFHENECYIVARKVAGELKRCELERIIQLKNYI